jgi:hypothetical protein
MKKNLLISMLVLLCFAPQIAFAQTQITVNAQPTGGCKGGTCTYVPLEPLPGVNQTGINFSAFVSGIFRLFITLGGLFAVLMLVIAGITYMVASSPGQISSAKERATSALYGLLLLTACWLILYTINPNLLRFDLFDKEIDRYAQKNTSPGSPATGAATQTQPTRAQIDNCTASQGGLGRVTFSANGSWACEYVGQY